MPPTPDRDALLRALHAEGKTQQEIADALGVSRPRVAQLLARLRGPQDVPSPPPADPMPDPTLNLYTTPLQHWMDSVALDAPTDEDRAVLKSAVDQGSEAEPAWHAARIEGVRNPLKTLKARMRLIAAGDVPATRAVVHPGCTPTHKLIRQLAIAAADVMQWGAAYIPELERAAQALVERNDQHLDPLAADFVLVADALVSGAQALQREKARAAQLHAQLQAAVSGNPTMPASAQETPEQQAAEHRRLLQSFANTFDE